MERGTNPSIRPLDPISPTRNLLRASLSWEFLLLKAKVCRRKGLLKGRGENKKSFRRPPFGGAGSGRSFSENGFVQLPATAGLEALPWALRATSL